MSKRTHIREFLSFQSKRKGTESINESVVRREKSFMVNGVEVEQKAVNNYIKRVKETLKKDVKSAFSEEQVAEELLRWAANKLNDEDFVPSTALYGDEEMAQDLEDEDNTSEIDETGDLDIEETDEPEEDNTDLDDEPAEGEDTEGDEDFDVNFDDDEFESPAGEDTDDDEIDVEEFEGEEGEEGEDTDEDEDEDEDTDLPV